MKNSHSFFSLAMAIIFLLNPAFGQEEERPVGSLKGIIRDRSTQQPLPFANVILMDTPMGAATGPDGKFVVENVPAGSYNVKVMMMGYRPVVKTDVIVNPNRATTLVVQMAGEILRGEEVTITANYFSKTNDAFTSSRSLNYEEIRRAPGAAEDVQRVIQALPSVANSNDQNNEIIVRGGSPIENLTLLDNIEIPNSNHFGYQGGTGGPINMINTDFIQEIDFITGGFPAKYGDKLSSVLDISLREGNRERLVGDLNLSMAGAGGTFEGPLANGRGSWLFSARKSYLDLILSPIGLTAVPHYWDTQGKAVYDLGPRNWLIFNGIYGSDYIKIEEEGAYSRGANRVEARSHQYALGLTWKSLWSKKGYSLFTISKSLNFWDTMVDEEDGTVVYDNKSIEIEYTAKADFTYQFSRRNEMGWGISYKPVRFDHEIWWGADTTEYYFSGNTNADTTVITPAHDTNDRIKSFKSAVYIQFKWRPVEKLMLNLGLRHDYFDYSRRKNLSPRLGLTYHLSNLTSINAVYGEFYQTPPYYYYTQDPNGGNRTVKNHHCRHFVLGFEHLLGEGLLGSIEAYWKLYNDILIGEQFLSSDDTFRSWKLVNEGEGFSRGIEFFLQQKLVKNYYGTISYSYGISRAQDPREDAQVREFNWDYDFRHVFTYIFGVKTCFKRFDWYKKWQSSPLGFLTHVLPIGGDELELAFRWRYLGGLPYTPKDWEFDPVTRDSVWVDGEINSQRYPPYHRLDIRFDNRYHFKNWNIVVYLDLENAYNRRNIAFYEYNVDGARNTVYQFSILPVGGVSFEF